MEKRIYKHGIIYNCDIIELLKSDELEKGSFSHIFTDPPYGYLEHRIEKTFDRKLCFNLISEKHCEGFFVIFGRGDIFYKDNLILDELGYKHYEDCGYIKNTPPSPFLKILRVMENFSIRVKGKRVANKVYIPLSDKNLVSDAQIVEWIRNASTSKSKEEIYNYLFKKDYNIFNLELKAREKVTFKDNNTKVSDRGLSSFRSLERGLQLRNFMTVKRELLKEGSHPTIKNHQVLSYYIQAISNENEIIFDPFIGSGTTAIACLKSGRRFIGCEIDKEYFNLTCKRIEKEYEKNLFL